MLSLAAGTVLDAGPVELIEAAAAAGFEACGLRIDPAATPPAMVAAIRRSLSDTGVRVLDLEVIRMRSGEPVTTYRPLVDLAVELEAAYLLTVSEIADEVERLDRLAELTGLAAAVGVGVSLEFMAFTAIRTLADAARLARAVPGVRVLVDALHLARTGGTAAEVAAGTAPLSLVQLCDAPREAPAGGLEALAVEARHHRLLPGAGQLDLSSLVAAVPPELPFSVEVQSDELAAELTVRQRANAAHRAGASLLARAGRAGRAAGQAGSALGT